MWYYGALGGKFIDYCWDSR